MWAALSNPRAGRTPSDAPVAAEAACTLGIDVALEWLGRALRARAATSAPGGPAEPSPSAVSGAESAQLALATSAPGLATSAPGLATSVPGLAISARAGGAADAPHARGISEACMRMVRADPHHCAPQNQAHSSAYCQEHESHINTYIDSFVSKAGLCQR